MIVKKVNRIIFSASLEAAIHQRYDVSVTWPERIIVDPEILAGKPVIRGTRLAADPGLTREDILACLSYASYLAHEYKAYPIPA